MPVRPLRRRTPFIGPVPGGVVVAAPARRPSAALVVALAIGSATPVAGRVSLSRPPSRNTTPPRPAPAPLVVRAQPPAPRGAARLQRLPSPTPRLTSSQEDILLLPRPYPEPRRGSAWTSAPHRDTTPRTAKTALLARRDERRFAGSVWLNKAPDRTLRLGSFQEDALVVLAPKPEPRRGSVWLAAPHRDTTPRTAKTVAVVRRDERRFGGAVRINKVPGRTVRLNSFQEGVLVARRDERRFAGRVVLSAPSRTNVVVVTTRPARPLVVRRDERGYAGGLYLVRLPGRTVRLAPFQETLSVVRRDERRFAGTVFLSLPHRPGTLVIVQSTGKLPVTVVRRDERRFAGVVWQNRVPSLTVRLSAFQESVRIARRDGRRYAGFAWQSRVPGRTVRLDAPALTALVVPAPKPEPRRGLGWSSRPHPDTTARPAKSVLIVRPVPPPYRGATFIVKAPDRTVRLAAAQEGARVSRRDERAFAGRVVLSGPSRTGTLIIPPLVPRQRLAARDERRFAGAVFLSRVPGRTVRLAAFQAAPLLVRRDERRFTGTVISSPARRPVVVVVTPLSRPALIVRQQPPRPAVTPALTLGPKRLTMRLTPELVVGRIVTRQSFPFGGSALFVRPARPLIVPRLPRNLVVRRDERGFAGARWTSRYGRLNATIVTRGNPRAKVTLRAQPTATLVFVEG